MILSAGQTMPGGYTLVEMLDKLNYRSTWKAVKGNHTVDLSIFKTVTSDEYGGNNDLHEEIHDFLPKIEQLKQLPNIKGLAPLLDYHYDQQLSILVIVQGFYPLRLVDHYTGGEISRENTLKLMSEIATTFDTLREHIPDMNFFIYPDRLMLEEERVIVADYGLKNLEEFIFRNAPHAHMVGMFDYFYLPKWDNIPAVFALACIYYYFRTGFIVIETPENIHQSMSEKILRVQKKYAEDGLALPLINNEEERHILWQATLDNQQAYTSCMALIEALYLV